MWIQSYFMPTFSGDDVIVYRYIFYMSIHKLPGSEAHFSSYHSTSFIELCSSNRNNQYLLPY